MRSLITEVPAICDCFFRTCRCVCNAGPRVVELSSRRLALALEVGDDGAPWEAIAFSEGKLVFDPYRLSYGAHCKEHRGCKINRVLSKRPVGYLVAWLVASDQYGTEAEHKAAKSLSGPGQPLSLQCRQDARSYFASLPGAQAWLDREGPPKDGEDEPRRV